MKTKINYSQIILFCLFYLVQVKVHAEWQVDLSRRQVDFDRIQNVRMPASVVPSEVAEDKSERAKFEVAEAIKRATTVVEVGSEIVIAQTENGFVPSVISLQKGQLYTIHVVNVNSKEKNVSFLMDAFSQSHNTVYGSVRTFSINPNIEGQFSYQSPETGASGTVVVVGDPKRKVASTEEKGK